MVHLYASFCSIKTVFHYDIYLKLNLATNIYVQVVIGIDFSLNRVSTHTTSTLAASRMGVDSFWYLSFDDR